MQLKYIKKLIKSIIQITSGVLFGFLLTLALILTQDISLNQAKANNANTTIVQTDADIRVIPDKYNTGCKGTLTSVLMNTEGMLVNGITLVAGSNATRYVLDFAYRNKNISGTVYIENCNFSDYAFVVYNENKVERNIKVIFNNCQFSSVSVGRTKENLSYEFNNCTMNSFYGSNSTFNRCKFGDNYSDGIVPFCNIYVNDCFFSDFTSVSTDKGAHIDATQLYGHADVEIHNVIYTNCRFEIPPLKLSSSSAYVNAAIMLQIEYNNAKDVTFKDCIVNGGGYSIYAINKKDGLTFTNVTFDGIKFGSGYKYGVVYTKINKAVKFKNISAQDSLYIGSVWKEGENTHFSVTNDTNRERSLLIYTDKGTYTYTIPACPTGSEFSESMMYKNMPFDIDIVVPADCKYAVCYDNTTNGLGKQIRFMNWNDSCVYIPANISNTLFSGANDILTSGKCGNDITFTLTKSGILTLTGKGSTYNYNSAKFPEWIQYKDYIKEIRVGEGIEGLGSMIFRQHASIEKVILPNTLKSIGQYAFGGCVSLDEFTIPANVTAMGNSVMSGTVLSKINYAGDNWSAVSLGTGNDNLVERLVISDNNKTPSSTDTQNTPTTEAAQDTPTTPVATTSPVTPSISTKPLTSATTDETDTTDIENEGLTVDLSANITDSQNAGLNTNNNTTENDTIDNMEDYNKTDNSGIIICIVILIIVTICALYGFNVLTKKKHGK